MVNPITFIREDHCPNCNSEKSVECYDAFNRPIYFSALLDKGLETVLQRLNMIEIYYMKCKKCNQLYIINWMNNGGIPRPLILKEFYTQQFLNKLTYK